MCDTRVSISERVCVVTGSPGQTASRPGVSHRAMTEVLAPIKNGKRIEELKKNDFTLTEDRKQQQIAVFDFQKLDNITGR